MKVNGRETIITRGSQPVVPVAIDARELGEVIFSWQAAPLLLPQNMTRLHAPIAVSYPGGAFLSKDDH